MKTLSFFTVTSFIAVLELARQATTPVAWVGTLFLGTFIFLGLVFLGEKMQERS
jgi:hypothetical protein